MGHKADHHVSAYAASVTQFGLEKFDIRRMTRPAKSVSVALRAAGPSHSDVAALDIRRRAQLRSTGVDPRECRPMVPASRDTRVNRYI